VALVTALAEETPAESLCVARVRRGDREVDAAFQVRASPITLEDEPYVLLFLQDVTGPRRWAELERAFYHDISNLVQSVGALAWSLDSIASGQLGDATTQLRRLVDRLCSEVATQRVLSRGQPGGYRTTRERVRISNLLRELQDILGRHPAAQQKHLDLPDQLPRQQIKTDPALLLRVLTNMLLNALEATAPDGTVRLWLEGDEASLTFCVWNRQVMSEPVALRVFQRHFTTKGGAGRGVGTFSMKLFGEEYLGGTVSFTSVEPQGTTFRVRLPA
jgi:signal transduction histidine kinase